MSDPEVGWERGWEGHERAQLRRLAALSFADKLAWLEQAQRFVMALSRDRASVVCDGKPPAP